MLLGFGSSLFSSPLFSCCGSGEGGDGDVGYNRSGGGGGYGGGGRHEGGGGYNRNGGGGYGNSCGWWLWRRWF